MQTNDLLALMDREVDTLAADNSHAAAALMRAAATKIRELRGSGLTLDQVLSVRTDEERCAMYAEAMTHDPREHGPLRNWNAQRE